MIPVHGSIATGSDTLQEVVGETNSTYHNVKIWNRGSSNPALVVFGDNDAHSVAVPASSQVTLSDLSEYKAVKAKNLDSGSNFANLHVTVW